MHKIIALGAMIVFLAGCATRSISDSGYRGPSGSRGSGSGWYMGELTELDILGAAPRQDATEANIAKSLKEAVTPRLQRGDKMIVIQSGAFVPDSAFVDEASLYFDVAPFSGLPPSDKAGLAESLRLRAAQGGCRFIVCYWGVLESAQEPKEGKVLSWVPIVGNAVPDQRQQMRIRLKALVLNVETGGWKMLMPEAHSDSSMNSGWSREASDQKMVLALKDKGYKRLVTDLMK